MIDWSAIRTCVLDMDGTLLDLHFDDMVWNERLPLRFARVAGVDEGAARQHVRDTLLAERGSLRWYCFDHWSSTFGLPLASVEAELQHLVAVRSGVLRFLESLQRAPLRVVLATNAHPHSLARKLAITRLERYFDAVVSAHDIGRAKEEAGFWPSLCQRFAIEPASTVLVDDNHAVLRTAATFGIREVFAVARPNSRGEKVSSEEFHCLDDLNDLASGLHEQATLAATTSQTPRPA